jgi:hypothetical protein
MLYGSESTGSAFSVVLLRNVCDPGANAEAVFSTAHPMLLMRKRIGHDPQGRPLRYFN